MTNNTEARDAIRQAFIVFDEVELMTREIELSTALICLKYRLPKEVKDAIGSDRVSVAVDVLGLIAGSLNELIEAKAKERAERIDALINGG